MHDCEVPSPGAAWRRARSTASTSAIAERLLARRWLGRRLRRPLLRVPVGRRLRLRGGRVRTVGAG